ncbi:hypothetical protein EC970246_3444 [Escherichia coli 97.0246]|uniref:Uncharacterized protein n=1 Tax=Escherichia coli 97.0246 TaxID=869670 RepID=A0A8E0KUC1_ECOLX|nr:hypothetical protein EC970246_3444 [Escherichia coli 97.0246]
MFFYLTTSLPAPFWSENMMFFCIFNALLINDKQFFIIDIINAFFSYK